MSFSAIVSRYLRASVGGWNEKFVSHLRLFYASMRSAGVAASKSDTVKAWADLQVALEELAHAFDAVEAKGTARALKELAESHEKAGKATYEGIEEQRQAFCSAFMATAAPLKAMVGAAQRKEEGFEDSLMALMGLLMTLQKAYKKGKDALLSMQTDAATRELVNYASAVSRSKKGK